MSNQRHPLLDEIEAFLAETGMGPVYFGKMASKRSSLVEDLRNGGDVRMRTAVAIRKWMADRRSERASRENAA